MKGDTSVTEHGICHFWVLNLTFSKLQCLWVIHLNCVLLYQPKQTEELMQKKKKIRVMNFHPFWGRDSWPMWSNIESLSNESAPQNHCMPGTKAKDAVCSSLIYFWSYLWNIFLMSFKMVTQIIWQRTEHTQQRTNKQTSISHNLPLKYFRFL